MRAVIELLNNMGEFWSGVSGNAIAGLIVLAVGGITSYVARAWFKRAPAAPAEATHQPIETCKVRAQAGSLAAGGDINVGGWLHLIGHTETDPTHHHHTELAKQLRKTVYDARDAIDQARERYNYGQDGGTREPVNGETEDERLRRNNLYAPAERLEAHRHLFEKLRTSKNDFAATFGSETLEPIKTILSIHDLVSCASKYLLRHSQRDYPKYPCNEEERKDELRQEAIIWRHDLGKDELSQSLAEAVSKIDEISRQTLDGQKA